MVPCIVQSIGMVLGSISMLLTFAICLMPHWRVSIVAESNGYGKRLDGYWISRYDGLWVTCVRQSGSPMSCQSYFASSSLTPDLKISKVFMCFAVLTAIGGFSTGLMGILVNKCCKKHISSHRCFLLLAGLCYIFAGILVLMPVTLVAINVMRNVCFSSCKSIQQQEIGEAVMLGWPTALMFFIGGAIFCWYHPCYCRNGKCVTPADECQPQPYPYTEGKPLARELQVFRYQARRNDDLTI